MQRRRTLFYILRLRTPTIPLFSLSSLLFLPFSQAYLEDYPFPFYLVLKDVKQLPEALGDALRQWLRHLALSGN